VRTGSFQRGGFLGCFPRSILYARTAKEVTVASGTGRRPDRAVPALLFFHGSGGDADDMDATYPAP
jgi:hypothetical protein